MVARDQRIAKITLDERTVLRRNADIEHERAAAILDLLTANSFVPAPGRDGPFHVHLAMKGSRLTLEIRSTADVVLDRLSVPITEFRSIIKDYFLICESYNQAVRTAPLSRIAAIDEGRRALHNEASELLRDKLADRVTMDLDTARRLFTLICVLQIRG
jgi:uncharacterized protein (UPF0262 family)